MLKLTRLTLPSGLTVLIETLPYVRSVALGYYLRSGSAVETVEHAGASHFLEHLVFKGTATRSTSDIARVIDILGGDVDAFTGKEYTSFYAHVLDEQVSTALDLLTEIVAAPRFTADDVESERSVILEEIKMVEDTPDDLVHELFVTAFWPDPPLGRPLLGSEETVQSLAREQIVAHYEETFHPSNMIFCASGNVKPDEIVRFLERAFPVDGKAPVTRTWSEPSPNQHVILREKKELEQVHLCLGSRGFPQQGEGREGVAPLPAHPREGRPRLQRHLVSQRSHERRLPGRLRRLRAAQPEKSADHDARGDAQHQDDRRDGRRAARGEAAPERLDPPRPRVDREPHVRTGAAGVLLRPPVQPGRDYRAHRRRQPRRHPARRRDDRRRGIAVVDAARKSEITGDIDRGTAGSDRLTQSCVLRPGS